MRILVLGHRGRLGHVGVRYLKEMGHEVLTIDKRYDPSYQDSFFHRISYIKPDVIINCIALTGVLTDVLTDKKDDMNSNTSEMMTINVALPLQLSVRFPRSIIIHPSTDGIFSGNKGWYNVNDIPDATDIYGISKVLGEMVYKYHNTWIIRCSTIGPEKVSELKNNNGLLEWFLSQNDNILQGYTNHKWNGNTTLEWMKCVHELLTMIKNGKGTVDNVNRIIQPGTKEVYSKAEMLHMFSDVWKKDIKIIDTESTIDIDRSLEPTWERKPLLEQLRELHNWYGQWMKI